MYMEKEQKKNETKEKKPLTEQQRQQRKKMLVYPLMGLLFLGSLWLIFAPSSEDREKAKQGQGFNTDMPLPEDSKIIGDKAKAYEQLQLEHRQKERRGMVGDLSSFWHDGAEKPDTAAASDDYRLTQTEPSENERADKQQAGIRTSAAAYERLNTSLGTFYETPKEDREKEELRERIDELEAMLMAQEGKPSSMEEQVALLEKSYELAARYMNDGGQNGQVAQVPVAGTVTQKPQAQPVQAIRETTVSGLQQPMNDADFIRAYSQPRNYGFNTAVGTGYAMGKNTVAACIHQDQTLTDGQAVKLRLLEPMQAGNIVVPKNTLVAGTAKVQGERLDILVSSIEYAGNIIPVELAVFDTDGQKGLSVPSSMEQEAFNEAMANIGSGLGTSISFAQSAGQQVAMDVTRGLLQGTSGYLAKKFRTVKVKLKAGYKVMLYAKQQ